VIRLQFGSEVRVSPRSKQSTRPEKRMRNGANLLSLAESIISSSCAVLHAVRLVPEILCRSRAHAGQETACQLDLLPENRPGLPVFWADFEGVFLELDRDMRREDRGKAEGIHQARRKRDMYEARLFRN
jgi:hypothetical protein